MLCLFTALDSLKVLRLRLCCCGLLCPLAVGKGASVTVSADSDLDVAGQVESKEKVLKKLCSFSFIYKV